MYEGLSVSFICKELGLDYVGENVIIDGLNLLGRFTTKASVLSYVTGLKYKKKIATEETIKAILVAPEFAKDYELIFKERNGCLILSNEPEKDFYQIHSYLVARGDFYRPMIEKGFVAETAVIHPTAIIEDHVIIEDRVQIGAFSIVKAGSIIKHDSVIGNHSIIGAEGFQVLRFDGIPMKIKHCGSVIIDEYVAIGDYCAVCNTLFDGFTHVGSHTKIDNYCQIAHYAEIGKNVIIPAGVTIVGSVKVEDNCYIGAGSTIMNKAVIHEGAKVGLGSVVLKSVKAGVTVFGNPAINIY